MSSSGLTASGAVASKQETAAVALAAAAEGITLVKDATLFKSEPNPAWFGNKPNAEGAEVASWSNENWLKSRFHFNFAEYSGGRSNFGPLRVANDDLVQPHRGFGTHPHANVEIVTYIVHGHLTHQDSMGTAETLTNGDVQFMTAGHGVRHSEHNLGDTPLRFIQMWFSTREYGLTPNYGSMRGNPDLRHNQWHHIVSDVQRYHAKATTPEEKQESVQGSDAALDATKDDGSDILVEQKADSTVPDSLPHVPRILINQDVNMFVTDLDKQRTLPYHVAADRQAYLICLKGSNVALGKDRLVSKHDAAMIRGGTAFAVQTSSDSGASILLIDVPQKFPPRNQ